MWAPGRCGLASVAGSADCLLRHELRLEADTVSELLTYDLTESVATITMDDGKVNCLSCATRRTAISPAERAKTGGGVFGSDG